MQFLAGGQRRVNPSQATSEVDGLFVEPSLVNAAKGAAGGAAFGAGAAALTKARVVYEAPTPTR